jgi:hypothetical protein
VAIHQDVRFVSGFTKTFRFQVPANRISYFLQYERIVEFRKSALAFDFTDRERFDFGKIHFVIEVNCPLVGYDNR